MKVMKVMKKIVLIFAFSMFAMSIFAQSGAIRGSVIDGEGNYLPFANIAIKGTAKGTASDMEGKYVLTGVDAGEKTLVVSYIGYKKVEQKVTVSSGKTTVLNIKLSGDMMLEEVIINSRLEGQSRAINSQKNSLNLTNVVDAEQMERFPDSNIGDAMKRITGVNVQYDQGEARFGNIRGTAPQLNSVTINGERVPSAEAEIRSIQLDLIPSDMIQFVVLHKAITPDMDADAIGGSVDLITKSAPYKRVISGKLGSGYNFVADKPIYKGSLMFADRFAEDKLGVIVSASILDNNLGSDNIEAEWEYDDANDNDKFDEGEGVTLKEFQNRQYYLERLRQSYSAAIDYKIADNHTLYLNGMYNVRKDWENRYRLTLEPDGDVFVLVRQTKFGVEDNKFARLEDQRMMNFSLGGDHLFGKVKVDWSFAYSKASEERPQERYIEYENVLSGISFDYSDFEKPLINGNTAFDNSWELAELTEEYQYTEEVDKNFRLNIEIPFLTGENANRLKLGVRYRGKSKYRDNDFYEYSPTDEDAFNAIVFANTEDMTKDDFMPGDYELGNFVSKELSNEIDIYNTADFEEEQKIDELAGNFDASENILAGYAMFTQNIGSKITLLAGVRVEQTMLEYQGYAYFEEQEDDLGNVIQEEELIKSDVVTDEYFNVLPGFHVKYSPNSNANIRFAWTNTIARPNYFDLVPYQEINEDNEIQLGNSELEPTQSMNFDLLGEYFFQNIGLFTGGVFYKDLSNVVAFEHRDDFDYQGHTYDAFRRPINIGDATLIGAEVAFQRRLDFLPSILKNLSFYGNYTYTKSKLQNIAIEGREGEDLPMGGSPPSMYNLSLAYDSKKFDARISFNHSDAFLTSDDDGGFAEEAFEDFYYDKVNYLDFNFDYKINTNFKVYVSANNLLNQPLRTYWGSSERTAQAEYYGIKLKAGIKFKF